MSRSLCSEGWNGASEQRATNGGNKRGSLSRAIQGVERMGGNTRGQAMKT